MAVRKDGGGRRVCLTVDLEGDCPPYLHTWRGIDLGAPRLLDLLAAEGVRATFFATGEVARRSPEVVERLLAAGHELGGHGDTHRDFTRLDAAEAETEIARSTATLRRFAPVTAFRAPYLKLPPAYLPLLAAYGYRRDSSQARYKRDGWRAAAGAGQAGADGLRRIPASLTSSALRLPAVLRSLYLDRLAEPVVLFVHPWEFVDLRRERLRLDCRFRTGDTALGCLRAVIHHLRRQEAVFYTLGELP